MPRARRKPKSRLLCLFQPCRSSRASCSGARPRETSRPSALDAASLCSWQRGRAGYVVPRLRPSGFASEEISLARRSQRGAGRPRGAPWLAYCRCLAVKMQVCPPPRFPRANPQSPLRVFGYLGSLEACNGPGFVPLVGRRRRRGASAEGHTELRQEPPLSRECLMKDSC